jgi:YidC/Oxa1 family membrane protein insertase
MIRVLPIAMLGTQVLMQKMTPATTGDATQQKMMMFMMPVMMAVMFYNAPSGLVLYWLTGNVVNIFQQYAFNKMSPTPVPVAVVTPKKKR